MALLLDGIWWRVCNQLWRASTLHNISTNSSQLSTNSSQLSTNSSQLSTNYQHMSKNSPHLRRNSQKTEYNQCWVILYSLLILYSGELLLYSIFYSETRYSTRILLKSIENRLKRLTFKALRRKRRKVKIWQKKWIFLSRPYLYFNF